MAAVTLVLEPIFEADLPPQQHAYRAGKNAHTAVREVHSLLNKGHRAVVNADLTLISQAFRPDSSLSEVPETANQLNLFEI